MAETSTCKEKMAPIQHEAVSDWEKAVHNKYSLMRISKFRVAVIERNAFSPDYWGVKNVCFHSEVFRGTVYRGTETVTEGLTLQPRLRRLLTTGSSLGLRPWISPICTDWARWYTARGWMAKYSSPDKFKETGK